MHSTSDFSKDLLAASDTEKINYFTNFTVVHRLLKQAYEEFLDAVSGGVFIGEVFCNLISKYLKNICDGE